MSSGQIRSRGSVPFSKDGRSRELTPQLRDPSSRNGAICVPQRLSATRPPGTCSNCLNAYDLAKLEKQGVAIKPKLISAAPRYSR